MFCQKCGKEIPEGAKMCPSCGTVIGQQAPAVDFAEFQKKLQEKFNGLSLETKLNWILAFTAFNAIVTLFGIIKVFMIMASFGRMF